MIKLENNKKYIDSGIIMPDIGAIDFNKAMKNTFGVLALIGYKFYPTT